MTISQLQDQLGRYPRDYEIYFSAGRGLTFYQLKQCGDKAVQMEFAENVSEDEEAKWSAEHPDDSIPLDPH